MNVSPVNEFLLHKCKNNKKCGNVKKKIEECTTPADEFLFHAGRQTDNRTYIYHPLDKRYSPIISTICGPNNGVGPINQPNKPNNNGPNSDSCVQI